jgi:hypothetical protein
VEGVHLDEASRTTNRNQKGETPEEERSVMKNRIHPIPSAARPLALATLALVALASVPLARAQDDARVPALPSPLCDSLQVPVGNEVAFHAFATGVQIYAWNGTAWVFVAPSATLFADAGYNGQVGTHYAGPTWQSNSGSKVVGKRLAGCSPDPNSIPWLKLLAISTQGPGIFDGVTFVQRVNTVGGKAPTAPGTTVGDLANVPYTAEYVFYRATD